MEGGNFPIVCILCILKNKLGRGAMVNGYMDAYFVSMTSERKFANTQILNQVQNDQHAQ